MEVRIRASRNDMFADPMISLLGAAAQPTKFWAPLHYRHTFPYRANGPVWIAPSPNVGHRARTMMHTFALGHSISHLLIFMALLFHCSALIQSCRSPTIW